MADKKKKIVHEVASVRDELADTLAEALNKANKDNGKVAFFLNEAEDPSKITDWISTGEHQLDIAIANRPNGGLPVGRITELTGLEACVTRDTKIKVIIE
jgi:RecA/RadA recombinase